MLRQLNRFALLFLLILPCAVIAGPYEFDASEFEKKPYSIGGNIELRPSVAVLNRTSESYESRYGTDGEPGMLDSYLSRLEMIADYRKGPFLFYASGIGFAQYERYHAILDYDAYPYEAYGRFGFEEKSTNVWVGKRAFKWGKGYTYNPTAFAARPKDINDVEANLEGFWSISGEFIHAFSSRVSTLALSAAIIPEYENLNRDYIGEEGVAAAGQMYLLAFDTDLDFCFYADQKSDLNAGIGFSRNVLPNLEIHGEAAYIPNHQASFITTQKDLDTIAGPAVNGVFGARYLTKWNTTIIAEYIHNGQGLFQEQMAAYLSALQDRSTLSPDARSFLSLNGDQYLTQFAMRNYGYAKLSHPEPFGILYFTPSGYAMINLEDKSLMAALEVAYARYKNASLTGKVVFLRGDSQSEYGSKIKELQLEFRGKYFF